MAEQTSSLPRRLISRIAGRIDDRINPMPSADAFNEALVEAMGSPPPTSSGAPVSLPDSIDAAMESAGSEMRMDSLENLAIGFGAFDKVSTGRPDLCRVGLTDEQLEQEWQYNGHARRFVEVVPNDAIRRGWLLDSEDGPVETEEEDQRLDVFSNVGQADIWGRLFGGGWILMVTTDDVTGTDHGRRLKAATNDAQRETILADWLKEPLDLDRVLSLDNLVVLDKTEVDPFTFDADPHSPTFREPLMCRITISHAGPTQGVFSKAVSAGMQVHSSRMLYFWGAKHTNRRRMSNNGYDQSILDHAWDQLRNKATTSHSLAMLATELKIAAVKMKSLISKQAGAKKNSFIERIKLLAITKSVANIVLLSEGEEYQHHTGTVTGMGELNTVMTQDLQAVTAMPEQLWLGSAPGGLSTDGDSHRRLWAAVISAYQMFKYLKILKRLYAVIFAAKEGPWRGKAPPGWKIKFRPLDEPTTLGETQKRNEQADLDVKYVTMGAITAEHVRRSRFGPGGWQDELLPIEEEATAAIDPAASGDPGAELDPDTLLEPELDVDGLREDADLELRRGFAEQLTAHGAKRCEHGNPNRCRLCGIERVRGLSLGPDGAPELDEQGQARFVLQWRAIGDSHHGEE